MLGTPILQALTHKFISFCFFYAYFPKPWWCDNLFINPQLILSLISEPVILINQCSIHEINRRRNLHVIEVLPPFKLSNMMNLTGLMQKPVLNTLLLSPATWPPRLWSRPWRRLMLSCAGRGGSRRRWAKDNSNNDEGCPSVNTSVADWTDVCLFTPCRQQLQHARTRVCQEECCRASAEQIQNKYIRKSWYASGFKSA